MSQIIAPEHGSNFAEEIGRQNKTHPFMKCRITQKQAERALKRTFDRLLAKHFISAFDRSTTGHRAVGVLQGMLAMSVGRRTLTNCQVVRGFDQKDWSANCRTFSVGKWRTVDIYEGVFNGARPLLGLTGPVVLGIDDTGIPKSGSEFESAGWIHNPLVPKYVRPAIQWGVPVLHAALLIQGEVVHRPTAITVAFEPIERENRKKRRSKPKSTSTQDPSLQVELPKRRGRPTKEEAARRKAERDTIIRDEEQAQTSSAVSDVKLKATELAVRVIWRVRKWMDSAGMGERTLLVVGDSSYTNGTVMMCLPHHTVYLGRTRPDSQLQAMGSATKEGRIKYGPSLPTPKEMAVDRLLDVNLGKFHYAGALRDLKFLELGPVFRKNSTRSMRLKLLVLEPVPYGKGETRGYNRRAYLLSTDLDMPAADLIAAYLMRWELEVIHRIWKTDLGIGDPQTKKHRIRAAMAAYYALLQVANLLTFGEERSEGFGPLSKWAANRRAYFERCQVAEGKPKPKYRATPTEIKNLIVRANSPRGTKVLPLIA